MLAFYIRSSSIGTYNLCQQQFFIRYVLGMPERSNKKADLGSCAHKCLELIALIAKNGKEFYDPEIDETISPDTSISTIVDKAFNYYSKKSDHHQWFPGDKRAVADNVNRVLTGWGGNFDPRKNKIVDVEHHFEIPVEWGDFTYEVRGEEITGQLMVKGTVDILYEEEFDGKKILHIVDYKTGKRLDWGTGKEKTLEYLQKDMQLSLYHWAISKSLPQYDVVIFSLLYVVDGGPFSLTFEREQLLETEAMLEKHFKEVLNLKIPKLREKSFFCTRVCEFGKTSFSGSSRTKCEDIHNEVVQLGIKKVVDNRANLDSLRTYHGGGKSLEAKE